MSNFIVGYVCLRESCEVIELEREIQQKYQLGFYFDSELTLYNFPERIQKRNDIVQFVVSDSADSNAAMMLLESREFAHVNESEDDSYYWIAPLLKDRVLAITKLILTLASKSFIQELGVSLTDSDQIDRIRNTTLAKFENLVLSDCLDQCPPNTLYVIIKNLNSAI